MKGKRYSLAYSAFALTILLLSATVCAKRVEAEPIQEEFTAFDLYLGSEFKGVVAAYWSEKSVRIENPQDAADVLGFPKVKEIFVGTINGKREAADGSVVVDTDIFRITVDLSSELLPLDKRSNDKIIAVTSETSSLRQDLQAFSFKSDEQSTGIVNGLTDLSLGSSWLHANWSIDDGDLPQDNIQELSVNKVKGEWKFSGGYLQSLGEQLVPSPMLAGINLQTIAQRLNGEEELRGGNFEIYVSSPSRVEFYRNGELIDVQQLTFGRQEVDTTRFPQGSYYVDVVVREGSGREIRERKFFSKSGILAPRGHPQFNFELGVLRQDTDTIDTLYGRGSVQYRISDPLQLDFSVFGTDEEQSIVQGFRAVIGEEIVDGAVSYSSEGEVGYSANASGKIFDINLSGSYERSRLLLLDDSVFFNDVPVPILPTTPDFNQERLREKGTRIDFSVSRYFGDIELRYQLRSQESDLSEKQYANGPIIRWRIFEGTDDSVFSEVGYFDTERGDETRAYLSYQHRFQPWTLAAQTTLTNSSKEKSHRPSVSLNYDTKESRTGLGTRGRVTAENQKTEETSTTTESLELEHGTQFGQLFLAGQTGTDLGTQTNIGYGVSFAVDQSGKVSSGPAGLGESLLIVDINSSDPDAAAEIILDGQKFRAVKGGGSVILGLTPYKQYLVSLKPSEESPLIDYDHEAKAVVLYPGNITRVTFDIGKVFVALGRILDENGAPIALKRLQGLKKSELTEEDGSFQAEIRGGETVSVLLDNGKTCSFMLKLREEDQYFSDFGDIICR